MKCWKCGQENVDGASICMYCRASQNRPAPTTDIGRAMRMLYDRYGAQEVFKNSAYLVNGLGDLAEDSKKLRNQLKTGMDAGLGRVYLEQLNTGMPDSAFDNRVKRLLTEDAGLNEKAAGEIARCFDEMIGWRAVKQNAGENTSGSDNINRNPGNNGRQPEIKRPNQPVNHHEPEIDPHKPQKPEAQTTVKAKRGWKDLYAYEKALIFCVAGAMILGCFVNQEHDPEFILDYVLYGIALIPLIMSFGLTKDKLRNEPFGGANLLTVLFGIIIIFTGMDFKSKADLVEALKTKTDATSKEMYLWQQHLYTQDLIFIATGIPMLIQMIRHRIQENKGTGGKQ